MDFVDWCGYVLKQKTKNRPVRLLWRYKTFNQGPCHCEMLVSCALAHRYGNYSGMQ